MLLSKLIHTFLASRYHDRHKDKWDIVPAFKELFNLLEAIGYAYKFNAKGSLRREQSVFP